MKDDIAGGKRQGVFQGAGRENNRTEPYAIMHPVIDKTAL
jgi:hypothetical protein